MPLSSYNKPFLIVCLISLVLATTGCSSEQSDQQPVDLNTETIFPVEVTHPAYEMVVRSLEAVGSFTPEEEVTLSAEIAGTVGRLFVDEGSAVTKGQALIEIDDEEVRLKVAETQALLREAQARLENSVTSLSRKTKLFKDGVIGQNDFDDATTQVSLNQAVLDKLAAKLKQSEKDLSDTRVIAPIDGVISERMVSVGEYVKVGAKLLKIVDSNPLKLVFSLPEINTADIGIGQKVSVTTNALSGKTYEGTIYFISPKADRETRTIEVKAWVENNNFALKPGFFVDVSVFIQEKKSLVLPESAVVVREGSILVMVVEEGRVVYKNITPGVRFNGKVEIVSGITPQDTVIFYGRSEITEGTPVKPVPAS